MTTRIYKYEIQSTKKGNRTYKKFIFTYVLEFKWQTTNDWLEKTRLYMRQYDKIHFVNKDTDGNYYVYMRYKRYLLDKGVNII